MTDQILFILRIPPPFGGGEIVSANLYQALKEKERYKFKLIHRSSHNKYSQSHFSLASLYYGIKYIMGILFCIGKIRPEIVYIGLPKSFFAFLRNSIIIHYCYFYDIKIIAELHGMSFNFDNKRVGRLILTKTLDKISAIRVLSSSIKKYISHYMPDGKVFVIDNGIDIPNFKYSLSNKSITSGIIKLLYIGSISESKGFSDVLNLIINLNSKQIPVELNVIGEWVSPKYKQTCQEVISNNTIENIIFHGLLTGQKKWRAMNENHFHLHFTKFDGQPLTIIETFGLGIPCFSTKVGAIPEMIENNKDGFLIESIDEVVNILISFKKQDINYSEISMNAKRKYLSRFNTQCMVSAIEDLINTIEDN